MRGLGGGQIANQSDDTAVWRVFLKRFRRVAVCRYRVIGPHLALFILSCLVALTFASPSRAASITLVSPPNGGHVSVSGPTVKLVLQWTNDFAGCTSPPTSVTAYLQGGPYKTFGPVPSSRLDSTDFPPLAASSRSGYVPLVRPILLPRRRHRPIRGALVSDRDEHDCPPPPPSSPTSPGGGAVAGKSTFAAAVASVVRRLNVDWAQLQVATLTGKPVSLALWKRLSADAGKALEVLSAARTSTATERKARSCYLQATRTFRLRVPWGSGRSRQSLRQQSNNC